MNKLSIFLVSIIFSVGAYSKQPVRDPASKTKGIPNSSYVCSNAMADHGYVVNIVTKKKKTTINIAESTFDGSIHKADLSCQRTKSGPIMPDQIFQTLECSSEKSTYRVEQYAGGFAGLITIDVFDGEQQVADDIICQRL